MTARTLAAFTPGVATGILITHTRRPDPTIYTGGES